MFHWDRLVGEGGDGDGENGGKWWAWNLRRLTLLCVLNMWNMGEIMQSSEDGHGREHLCDFRRLLILSVNYVYE